MLWIPIAIFIYVAIGAVGLMYIKRDNEFRYAELGEMLAWTSLVLWPITLTVWMMTRPDEQLQDLVSKKTHADFKKFMRERKHADYQPLKHLSQTSPEKPMELGHKPEEFRDHHLEDLIENKEWMEAIRTANDMLRFAREQQETDRVEAYVKYIKKIKEDRRIDSQ